jgi:hypothetical protein
MEAAGWADDAPPGCEKLTPPEPGSQGSTWDQLCWGLNLGLNLGASTWGLGGDRGEGGLYRGASRGSCYRGVEGISMVSGMGMGLPSQVPGLKRQPRTVFNAFS